MSDSTKADEWTIGRVLAWATSDFRAKGFDSPRLDAELLLCHALGCDRVKLVIDSNRPLVGDELTSFKQLIQRRRKAEPIAYILGQREFYGMSIRVDARVLIPRPDTEVLVETALRRTADQHLFGTALDVCTGSGCVAIALAKERPTWKVTGADISNDALELARDNALRLGVVRNLAFRQADLLSGFEQRFSLITANPPYIPTTELAELQPDIREFEPKLALDGGDDGLDFLRTLAGQVVRRLVPGGVFATEIASDQAADVSALLQAAGLTEIETTQDYAHLDRVVSGRAPSA